MGVKLVLSDISARECVKIKTYVNLLYKTNMQTFMLQTVKIMACSETNTHLLPVTLSAMVFGVNAACCSAVMKFDPPPVTILLKAMHSSVYQKTPLSIT